MDAKFGQRFEDRRCCLHCLRLDWERCVRLDRSPYSFARIALASQVRIDTAGALYRVRGERGSAPLV